MIASYIYILPLPSVTVIKAICSAASKDLTKVVYSGSWCRACDVSYGMRTTKFEIGLMLVVTSVTMLFAVQQWCAA